MPDLLIYEPAEPTPLGKKYSAWYKYIGLLYP